MAQTPLDDVKLLEQSAFNAGVAYAMETVNDALPGASLLIGYPHTAQMESAMEEWRQNATTKRLESKVRG